MERRVTFSALNQFRFIPLDEVLPDKYNFRQFDKALFSELQEYWMNKSAYAQKVQKTDPCRIQMKTSQNDFPPRLYVYKCGGELVSGPFSLTNFPLSPSLIEDGIERFVQTFSDVEFFNDLDGVYYLVIDCRFDEDGDGFVDFTDMFVSEPILVKEKHPKTILLEYSNSTNKDDIIFQQTRQKFCFRIEGAILKLEPKVNRVVFVDQGENSVQLSATPYRSWTISYGFTGGIPVWAIDKLNHIHACDFIYCEGKGYTNLEGSVLKYDQQIDSYGLAQVSIEVSEKNNASVYEYSKGGITMLEEAFAFPYVIRDTMIGYPGNYDYYYGTPVRIGDALELQAWIDARNAELVTAGLTGTIATSNGLVVYNRGLGENYTYANCTVFKRRLGINNITTGVFNIPLELEIRGGASTASWAVSGPTGTVLGWGQAPDSNTFIPNYVFSYVTPGAGTYSFELWHEGTIARLFMFGNSISAIDTYGIASTSLPPLANFGIDGSTRLTSFGFFGELNTLRPTLKTFRLRNNPNLTDIGFFVPPSSGITSGWLVLHDLILSNNRLSTATVDAWFNSMQDAMPTYFYVYGGSVFINGQLPPAGVTAASASARNDLMISWGWSLIY